MTPARLEYKFDKYKAPTIEWCGIPVTRAWRCGNEGNVASVLIEKPGRGDFLPIVDGGYALQYSPLMECREGSGMILFCQLDVTGRTASDPAAQRLARNMVDYVSGWKAAGVGRKAVYAGAAAGKAHLEKMGVTVGEYDGGALGADQVLIVGQGGGRELAGHAKEIGEWVKGGGNLLAVGLDESEVQSFLPFKVTMKKSEYITTTFEPFGMNSLLAGVGPADVHNRDPRILPLVTGGAKVFGDGVLAQSENGNVVFCQLAAWDFDYSKQYNLKRVYRRSSFVLARVLAEMGVAGTTPVVERIHEPVAAVKAEKRWSEGLYLDQAEEWDDPYRYFGW